MTNPKESSLRSITISQTMAVTAFVACMIALWQIPENGYQKIWKKEPLVYQQPTVPEFYLDPAHPRPANFSHSNAPPTDYQFENGRELYLVSHREGWEMCRGWFYGSNSESLPTEPRALEAKNGDYDAWHPRHVASSRRDGYLSCRQQLATLLEHVSADELRRQLAYSACWQKAPIWLFALVAMWFTGVHRFLITCVANAKQAIVENHKKSGT